MLSEEKICYKVQLNPQISFKLLKKFGFWEWDCLKPRKLLWGFLGGLVFASKGQDVAVSAQVSTEFFGPRKASSFKTVTTCCQIVKKMYFGGFLMKSRTSMLNAKSEAAISVVWKKDWKHI